MSFHSTFSAQKVNSIQTQNQGTVLDSIPDEPPDVARAVYVCLAIRLSLGENNTID